MSAEAYIHLTDGRERLNVPPVFARFELGTDWVARCRDVTFERVPKGLTIGGAEIEWLSAEGPQSVKAPCSPVATTRSRDRVTVGGLAVSICGES